VQRIREAENVAKREPRVDLTSFTNGVCTGVSVAGHRVRVRRQRGVVVAKQSKPRRITFEESHTTPLCLLQKVNHRREDALMATIADAVGPTS
jgi:hypothetical protein